MAFCTECGAKITEGMQFCTGCGKSVNVAKKPARDLTQAKTILLTEDEDPPRVAPIQTAPVYKNVQETVYSEQPSQGSPYAVMSVGSFVVASILMNIPVIGWLICIIWACGGCKNRNKRNYARAFLIFLLVWAVIGFLVFIIVNWFFGGITEVLQKYLDILSKI